MTEITINNIIPSFNWFTRMAKPQVNQTKALLDTLFKDKIDLSDVEKASSEQKTSMFYSRALAAYYLHAKTDITTEDAAKCVTDGYKDNGIDAIYYDNALNSLYLIQSKVINEGKGEPENGDILKFKQGVLDITDEKFDERFNKKILDKQQIIKDALQDKSTKLIIVLAYTGKGFADTNNITISEMMESLNDTLEWAYFDDFNLRAIYNSLLSATVSKPIDYDITISNWGAIEEPYKTYYGQISAFELANLFILQGKKLFSENIRSFIGLSTINSDILSTIKNEPENFIYFNNGITVICNDILPIPGKTLNKTTGTFVCKGMQIVNGAQTVGSLGTAFNDYAEQLKQASVFVRLIPLTNCPDDFGRRITIASNTQNKIEKRDFVSLDPIQQNLRTELALLGITYHYKRTDEPMPTDDKNCSLEEATVALAANNIEINNSVLAKREIGKLWDDIKSPPYTDLFNENLKGQVMWNSIKVYRAVQQYINSKKDEKTAREKSTYTYGNYFILNLIFYIIPKEKILNPNSDLNAYLSSDEFKDKIQELIDRAYAEGEKNYPSSLIHQLYRNYTKCKDLKIRVLGELGYI